MLYNRGLVNAMLTVEGIRAAQGKYGNKPLAGAHFGRVQQWDGKNWAFVADYIQADQGLLGPMVKAAAQNDADEKKITPGCLQGP